MKNLIRKSRKITVDNQKYRYLIEGYPEELTVSIWKNKVNFLVKDFKSTDITTDIIEELIREKEETTL